MTVKVLFEDTFKVVAMMDGAECPAEQFLLADDASTLAQRSGLLTMLEHAARMGLQHVPSGWLHEADKQRGIYEFIKGPLRLFFFKGANGDIAVCTFGVRKSGQKADKAAVAKSAKMKAAYEEAIKTGTYKVITDEN